MLSSRTIIGIVVGSAIIALGGYSLVTSFGLQQINFDDDFPPGDGTTYRFSAPEGAKQWINITGTSFSVDLRTPEGGIKIPKDEFKKELSIEWVHLVGGESKLELQNIGDSDIKAKGYFTKLTEPIMITYHILVITAGVVIIGFSAGFSIRKPKGF